MKYGNRELTAHEAAKVLEISERHAEALLKDRLIAGRQLRSGVWLTSKASVERYRATAQSGRGRALSASTAWGLLWELSGRRPSWLPSSTLARVRRQIETFSPEEIVRATSGRTRARFYTISRGTSDISWGNSLVRTGRPAARHLGVRAGNFNYASGYVRDGTSADFARRHAMSEDYEGRNVLFDNTLPITYPGAAMPDAVVAVDMTLTGGEYERERGLLALAMLQRKWMEARQKI
ncbi:hypothetical protein PQI51_12830 [Microbacterium esteraromaticum]|uniref:hypothetical protein n=1 Tax=Microbacterium esteraromaticum TaxID=57043 RepID=UPI0030B73DDA